jgi:ABC-2 type transport system ATP-binding protein
MATPSINTYGLSKRYHGAKNYALKDLELSINPGEIYGFLGPNGAGKTTAIRLLMNFIEPTRGEAKIVGLDTVNQSVAVKENVGYLAGEPAFYPKMSAAQLLEYLIELKSPVRPSYCYALARRLKLPLNQRIRDLSKGNRQKLALVTAFMNEPEVMILDEPTSGLDPLMQEIFFDMIRDAKARGAAVFLSSHNLSEVQKVCDRVGFIRGGKLIKEQSIGSFAKSFSQTYDIAFADKVPQAALRAIPGLKYLPNSSHHATVKMRGNLKPLFRLLAKYEVRSIDRQETGLEDEFLKFYKDSK